MDIGSAVGREKGISEEQLRDLACYTDSDAFSELEKRVLDLAVGASRTPAAIGDDLISELRKHLSREQLVELVASIAWENYRARFNCCLGIESANFSEGAYCALPEVPGA